MPKLGLTTEEGTLLEWRVQPGDHVKAGDLLCVLETDKTTVEVPAEHGGVVLELRAAPGDTVAVGNCLATMRVTRAAESSLDHDDERAVAAMRAPPPDPDGGCDRSDTGQPSESAAPGIALPDRVVATPYARRLGKELKVDLNALWRNRQGHRIRGADIAAEVASRSEYSDSRRLRRVAAHAAMARRVSQSKPGIPHFYLASEAEVSGLQALRASRRSSDGARPATITHFIVAAVGRALVDIPEANAIWDGDRITTLAESNVGVVVHTQDGLFLPVVREAGRKVLGRISEEVGALVDHARSDRLDPADTSGAAISISNAGMHGVTYLTPVVSTGQSAMLGVGSVRQVFRPDAEGKPSLRQELGLVLAADHRVFDGVSGLSLLNRIIAYLEVPDRLL
jgi:pyruvate dehydrogenase E2 component (dihydrolipoamide acetyltransferase)